MSNVTVPTALLELKKSKFACAFVLNLKSVFCSEAFTVSCNGLLAMEIVIMSASKGTANVIFGLAP